MGVIKLSMVVLMTAFLVGLLPTLLRKRVDNDLVYGSCTKDFAQVEQTFRKLFEDGLERGAGFSLHYKGESVCDMWGGYSYEKINRPWQEDTLGMWFSATKGVAAITLMTLHDRGLFDYKEKVSKYWPEFARNGKKDVTIETLVTHSAGFAAIDEDITMDMIRFQPEEVGRILAEHTPNWAPGTKHAYHALTFGLLIDQLVWRIDPKKRRIQQYFQEEIATKFGIDFYIGAPLSEHHRIAFFNMITPVDVLVSGDLGNVRGAFAHLYRQRMDPLFKRTFNNPRHGTSQREAADVNFYNWPEARSSPQPSVCGFGTARAISKLYGILANGGTAEKQKTLLSRASVEKLDTVLRTEYDHVIYKNVSFGYGVLHHYGDNNIHRFGHSGFGGQQGYADTYHKFGYAYVTSYPSMVLGENDIRSMHLRKAIYNVIRQLNAKS